MSVVPGVCPVPSPGDPLIASLLGATDCHVQQLVSVGYGALLGRGGTFSGVLTAGLTIYVALFGYQLLLGRSRASISDLTLSALKIGGVLALTTQWPLYEMLVYNLLFHGPEQVADAVLGSSGPRGRVDLIASLQHAFDDLTIFSPAAPPGPFHRDPRAAASLPTSIPQLMTPAAFDSLLFLYSAALLLIATLGVLLAAKIVLGLLLALGPIFVALFLFESTRGLCVGWLRASLAFALLPPLATIALALALALLAPSLGQIELMNESDTYIPGVAMRVFAIALLVLATTTGLTIAAGVISLALRLPGRRPSRPAPVASSRGAARPTAAPSRASRIVTAVAGQDRRRMTLADAVSVHERGVASPASPGAEAPTPSTRLGSEVVRRRVQPSVRGRRPD